MSELCKLSSRSFFMPSLVMLCSAAMAARPLERGASLMVCSFGAEDCAEVGVLCAPQDLQAVFMGL
eukprot:10980955-Alexandrium_andersonii.AAC.1